MHRIYMECKPAPICWCFVVSFKHSNKCFKQVVMQFFSLLFYFSFSTIAIAMHAIRNQLKLWFFASKEVQKSAFRERLATFKLCAGNHGQSATCQNDKHNLLQDFTQKNCQKFSYYLINQSLNVCYKKLYATSGKRATAVQENV